MNFEAKLEQALLVTPIAETRGDQRDMYHASLDKLHDSVAMQVAADALEELGGEERQLLADLLRRAVAPGYHDGVRVEAKKLQDVIAKRAKATLAGDAVIVVLEQSGSFQRDIIINLTASGVAGRLREQTMGHGNDGFKSDIVGTATGLEEILSHIPADRHDDVALLIGIRAVWEAVEGSDLVAVYDDEAGELSTNATQVTKRALLILSRARELASTFVYHLENGNLHEDRLEYIIGLCRDAAILADREGSPLDKRTVGERISHIRDGIWDARTAPSVMILRPHTDRLAGMVKHLAPDLQT